jgi:cbb3-type cytochrome oxidase subunit 1
MGIMDDFRLTGVHAHINLLGWVSMAIFALVYHFYPSATETRLAKLHFWLHNLWVPLMQGGLALQIRHSSRRIKAVRLNVNLFNTYSQNVSCHNYAMTKSQITYSTVILDYSYTPRVVPKRCHLLLIERLLEEPVSF